MIRVFIFPTAAALILTGCAWFQHTDPVQVTLVGVDSGAASEGFEARMQLKLRVQNPNDSPITYNGVSVELDVRDKSFASGVSNQSGTVPAFGEAVIAVPVTISIWSMAGQAMGLMSGKSLDKVSYAMHGKIGTVRFKSQGELNLSDLASGGS